MADAEIASTCRSHGAVLASHNIDVSELLRCVRGSCEAKHAPPSEQELAQREGTSPPPAAVGGLGELLSRPEFAEAFRKLLSDHAQ